jgi:hypothetical protein
MKNRTNIAQEDIVALDTYITITVDVRSFLIVAAGRAKPPPPIKTIKF